jgi:hypothetical protein
MFMALNAIIATNSKKAWKQIVDLQDELRKIGISTRDFILLKGEFTWSSSKRELEDIRDEWIKFYDSKASRAMMRGEDLRS